MTKIFTLAIACLPMIMRGYMVSFYNDSPNDVTFQIKTKLAGCCYNGCDIPVKPQSMEIYNMTGWCGGACFSDVQAEVMGLNPYKGSFGLAACNDAYVMFSGNSSQNYQVSTQGGGGIGKIFENVFVGAWTGFMAWLAVHALIDAEGWSKDDVKNKITTPLRNGADALRKAPDQLREGAQKFDQIAQQLAQKLPDLAAGMKKVNDGSQQVVNFLDTLESHAAELRADPKLRDELTKALTSLEEALRLIAYTKLESKAEIRAREEKDKQLKTDATIQQAISQLVTLFGQAHEAARQLSYNRNLFESQDNVTRYVDIINNINLQANDMQRWTAMGQGSVDATARSMQTLLDTINQQLGNYALDFVRKPDPALKAQAQQWLKTISDVVGQTKKIITDSLAHMNAKKFSAGALGDLQAYIIDSQKLAIKTKELLNQYSNELREKVTQSASGACLGPLPIRMRSWANQVEVVVNAPCIGPVPFCIKSWIEQAIAASKK